MDDFNNNNGTEDNGRVNLTKSPEPQNTDGDGGVNLFKAPDPSESERQGVSNAQQGMNFSGQTNFGGQPNPNPVPNQFGGYNQNPDPNQQGNNILAIISLVCGILSVITCCCCGIGTLFGIAGIITGVISRNKSTEGAGLALAGIITGAVGAVLGVVGGFLMGPAFIEGFLEGLESASIFFM